MGVDEQIRLEQSCPNREVNSHSEQQIVKDLLDHFASEFATFLRAERRRRRWSQKQLAQFLNSHQSFIGRLEQPFANGDSPSLRTMVSILVALGRRPDYFSFVPVQDESQSTKKKTFARRAYSNTLVVLPDVLKSRTKSPDRKDL